MRSAGGEEGDNGIEGRERMVSWIMRAWSEMAVDSCCNMRGSGSGFMVRKFVIVEMRRRILSRIAARSDGR